MTTNGTPKDLEMIKVVYAAFAEKVAAGRTLLGRPLTYTEKILLGHLHEPLSSAPERLAMAVTMPGPTARNVVLRTWCPT